MNDELQQRTDELNEVNAFLESVLGSLRAAVVVLVRGAILMMHAREEQPA